jgi:phosphopantothenoylcysteine synthetase/decarboxylase
LTNYNMNILVTAGNTIAPIDRVRVITNIFTGRTGTAIALRAQDRGHRVTLLTSQPQVVPELPVPGKLLPANLSIQPFHTFDELETLLQEAVCKSSYDAIIHSAAVSDHHVAGVYAAAPGTNFDLEHGTWCNSTGTGPSLMNRAAGKVKSDEPELWLRLVRNCKLVDRFRRDWGFRGILVKFKLEVGLSKDELLAIAEPSRRESQANLMVANTLESTAEWALLGPIGGRYENVARRLLPERLLGEVERLAGGEGHG